jgi:lysophospholipase L1-like esterase
MHLSLHKLLIVALLTIQVRTLAADESSPLRFTIFMVGDSTMTNAPVIPASPTRGWGQLLPLYFKGNLHIENHAMSGRSSKSFISEGRWKAVMERLKEGDYVIIQFGHNDEKNQDPKRFTAPFGEFTENLARFVREARGKKAFPILVTPVSRAIFEKDGTFRDTHGDYPKAVRELAKKENVPLLDLEARTRALYLQLGPERSKGLFGNAEPGDFPNLPKGHNDSTHFNAAGACRVCDFAIEEMKTAVPELAQFAKTSNPDPAK